MWARHGADFGSSRPNGLLAPVPAEPRSSRASGDSAVPQPLRRGIRPNLISPKSSGVGHIASDESPAPPSTRRGRCPGDRENPRGTARLVYLAVDWVDCNPDDWVSLIPGSEH